MQKIMFNDKYGLTQAVLKGRKTQTRRLVSPKTIEKAEQYRVEYFNETFDNIPLEDMLIDANQLMGVPSLSSYKVGEVVAIAQSYYDVFDTETPVVPEAKIAGVFNKMFTKADLMPHHIKITNIRVEHLQDISDEDCLQEGVISYDDVFGKGFMLDDEYNNNYRRHCFTTAKKAFATLIDKTSGKGTWNSNPYVFVYDFVRRD